MEQKICERYADLIGVERILSGPAMAQYLTGSEHPVAVVFPEDAEQLTKIVGLANDLGVKFAVGGGSVNSSGLHEGIAICLARMNRILEVDHRNLVATVEAGVSYRDFQKKINEEGLYFPPEPYRSQDSSIGSCFAVGDLDCKSFNYGPIRTYLLGFEMVLPTGELMTIGSKVIKNVAGYDLIHFIVGSRGTLGVITKLLIKLLPQPETRRAVIGSFASLSAVERCSKKLLAQRIYPTRLNLLNPMMAKNMSLALETDPANYLLLVDLEGFKPSTVHLADEISALFCLGGADRVIVAAESEPYARVWDGWFSVMEQYHTKLNTRSLDLMVGSANVWHALERLQNIVGSLAECPELVVFLLNGNIRLQVPDELNLATDALLCQVNALAVSLGGGLSGAAGHWIGGEQNNEPELWQNLVDIMTRLRTEFDPEGIMSPAVKTYT